MFVLEGLGDVYNIARNRPLDDSNVDDWLSGTKKRYCAVLS